jgi:hypothetical protein
MNEEAHTWAQKVALSQMIALSKEKKITLLKMYKRLLENEIPSMGN